MSPANFENASAPSGNNPVNEKIPRRTAPQRESMSKQPIEQDALRACAEARLATKAGAMPERPAAELLHELQVHQIELEIQNEELRRAQTALEESRDRYVDLFEFAPIGYFTLTATGLIDCVNLTGAKLLGEERKQLLNRRFSHFVEPKDRDLWHQRLMRMHMNTGKQSCELAMQRADGSPFQARMECQFQADGEMLPLVRIAIADITERKRAEEELRIAAIAFESQEGMLVTDANGVIVRVNQAFTRMTGYSAQEAIGKTLALLKSERQDESFYKNMWSVLQTKKQWQGEVWNRRKNGKIYAEWMTISAVNLPDGEVAHYVGTISDITHNGEAEAEIHRLAYYDSLTQLPNRRLLLDRLGQALASSSRNGRYGAVLYLDLDHFKTLNDTLGHDVGDLLLIEVAQRLLNSVREGDTISRLGGDEFVVVLENLSEEADEAAVQTELVGEKMREALTQPFDLEGHEFHGTTSIGIALFHGHEDTVESLLKQSDLALYQAKGCGRNCLRFFDQSMQLALNERSALEADLRLALNLGQLNLYYQAQIDRIHQQVIGAEVLLRWRHPKRGLVKPNVFLPLAEETGLILPIGQWVLKTVCQQLRTWSEYPATQDLSLAVNISARQFRQPGFVKEVQQVLQETGANPCRLKIELTERLVVENVADTIAKMQALKAIGIGFSMDNFGTGYSSLSDLKRLPLEQLKIDRCFVNDLTSDANGATIVRTIITMGQALGLKVIAEGVETEAQLDYLDHYDCATYQGNLYSQPAPLDEFEKALLEAG
jgi:diguanylate cyclase (GGDEF)-like protein/PAS domain S-box-containing protein